MEIYTTKRRSTAVILHFGNNEFQGTDDNLTLLDGVLTDCEGTAMQMRDLENIAFDKKDMIQTSPGQHRMARTLCMSSLMGQHLVQQFKVVSPDEQAQSSRISQPSTRRVDKHWLVCKQQPPQVFYQKVIFARANTVVSHHTFMCDRFCSCGAKERASSHAWL